MQQQWTISQSDCDMWQKVNFVQFSDWSEKKCQSISRSQACTKKKGHGHCLVVCCPSDSLQLCEFQRNHCIWELCSAHRWDAPKTTLAASIGQQKKASPSLWQCLTECDTINTSKVEHIGLWSLICHIHLTSRQPTTTSSSISTTFCRQNASITKRMQKMLSKSCQIPKHGFLHYRNKQTSFSLAKMCWL